MDKLSRITRLYILPIYWAFLTYMLLKPGDENQEYWFMFPGFDKVIHLSIFAFLGLLFLLSFRKIPFISFFQLMLCYGFLTEILQDAMKMGRAMEFGDVVADTVGILIGYATYLQLRNFLIKKSK